MSKNPFEEDDDEDVRDDEFLRHAKSGGSGYMFPEYMTDEQKKTALYKEELLKQKRAIEERTLQSSARSVGLIYDSERVGTETAQVCGFTEFKYKVSFITLFPTSCVHMYLYFFLTLKGLKKSF